VEPVLDLIDRAMQSRYAVTREALAGLGYGECHRVLRRALADGYRAIRAPSAALRRSVNLVIYPERSEGRLVLRNGPHREAINHGSAPLRATGP
jgi:hypothetical protein